MAQQRIAGRQTKPESAAGGLKKDSSGNYTINEGTTTRIVDSKLEVNPGNSTINSDLTTNHDAILSQDFLRMQLIGLINRSQISITLTGVDKDTVQISPISGGVFTYYWNGQTCTITGNKSVTLPGSPHSNGLYYIYINSSDGTLLISQTPFDIGAYVSICTVIWYQGNAEGSRSILGDEMHTPVMSAGVHKHIHMTTGTKLVSKGVMSGYTLQTAHDNATTYGIAQSVIVDEDIYHTIQSITDDNGVTAKYLIFNRDTSSDWAFGFNNFPFLIGGNGRLAKDSATGPVEIADGKYINTYIFFNNTPSSTGTAIIMGQQEYANLNDAYSEQLLDLSLTSFPFQEYIFTYKITWLTNNTFTNTGKCRIERVSSISISPKDVQDYAAAASIVQVAPLPGYIIDCRLNWISTTVIESNAGILEIGNLIYQNAIPKTIEWSNSQGGITKQNNTWYYVYAKQDPSDPGAWIPMISTTLPTRNQFGGTIASYSSTPKYHPTLNARFIGSFKTNSSGSYIRFRIVGQYVQYVGLGYNLILSNGLQTIKTAVNCRGFVPYTSDLSMFYYELASNNALRYLGDAYAWYWKGSGPDGGSIQLPVTNDSVYYMCSNNNGISIGVYGYYEII